MVWMAKLLWGTSTSMRYMNDVDEADPYSKISPISHRYVHLFNSIFYLRIEPLHKSGLSSWKPKWQAACFISITVWYILNKCPKTAREALSNSWLWTDLPQLPTEELSHETEPKTALLQWYHAICVQTYMRCFTPNH